VERRHSGEASSPLADNLTERLVSAYGEAAGAVDGLRARTHLNDCLIYTTTSPRDKA
jgi:hypothetical protein